MMFDYSEDQIAIADTASRVFADLCSDRRIRELAESKLNIDTELWQQLAELGLLGLPIDQRYGGSNLSLAEFCMIVEAQGKYLAPVPLLSAIVECAMTLNDCDNTALKQRLLPSVVSGEAMLSPTGSYTGLIEETALTLQKDDGHYRLNGRSSFAPYASIATGFIVSVESVILYVDTDTVGLEVIPQRAISGEVAGFLRFDNLKVNSQNLIATIDQADQLGDRQQNRAWIALSAMQTGVLSEGIQRTAEYLNQRRQFGRPLGAFQAVSQQMADAYMDIEALRSVYWRALGAIEDDLELFQYAAVAKYWTATAGHSVGHKILHLHGGIGQDLNYPIHRYFLWAKQCERYLGSAAQVTPALGKFIAQQPIAI